MNSQQLRRNLAELLTGGQAHVGSDVSVFRMPRRYRTVRPAQMPHSAWELLEHMRRAQEDILRYTLDPDWESPPFPDGYWPENPLSLPDRDWNISVSGFLSDLDAVVSLANNDKIDLTSLVPHGEGRTYLRQVLLVADHNSYHLGQFVQVKKALGLKI